MKAFSTRVHLSQEGENKNAAICKAFVRLARTVELLVPPTEYAVVSSKLQEAFFWAQQGMRSLPVNRRGMPKDRSIHVIQGGSKDAR